ncbi:MAG: protein kinase [Deltaproteobacteria bacterium]|nr:protein kinase [Deltaproteobacteria bacterium]
MPSSEAERVIAGFTLGERLSAGLYGEVFRARGLEDDRREVRALLVDKALAAEPAFANALMDDSRRTVTALVSRAIVATHAIARTGGQLLVVTDPVIGGATLQDLLAEARGQGGKLPTDFAAAIARSVIDGLATAHALGLVHGAVHPRSIVIDSNGAVRIADIAVGRALSRAAAAGADASLTRGLAGYLAPEVALGETPGPAADVYAVGALLFQMLTGEVPPGQLRLSPAVERLVQRALDTDLHRRFENAIELQENFAEALDDDHWEPVTQAELARWVGDSRVATAANLDEATEDLLASLADAVREPPTRRATSPQPLAAGARPASAPHDDGLDGLLAELDDTGDEPHTQVDPTRAIDRDPVSALIALEPPPPGVTPLVIAETKRRPGKDADRTDTTPLPTPAPDEPGTITRAGDDLAPGTGRRRIVEMAALDAIDELADDLPEAAPAAKPAAAKPAAAKPAPAKPAPATSAPVAKAAVPRPATIPAPELDTRLGRSTLANVIWGLVVLAAAGVLIFVVMRSGRENEQNRKDADALAKAQAEAAQAETLRRTAELADPGGIRIHSTPDGAAVWIKLGRTPFDSMGLPTSMVHELRVEQDGYKPRDLDVGGRDWQAGIAKLTVTLERGEATLPAVPPEPDPALKAGLAEGRGVLHVESTPPGAAVWLLVGVTPSMDLEGIEAGRDYELRVVKDGFLPAYVQIPAEEWRLDPKDTRTSLASAKKKDAIERSVTLEPVKPGRK